MSTAVGLVLTSLSTVGTSVIAIKAVTDKFLFDASNFVKSAAQSMVGYVAPPSVAEITQATPIQVNPTAVNVTTETVDLGEIPAHLEYIYDLYHVLPTDRPPLPPISDPTTPGMVTLAVVLRDGHTHLVGATATATMKQLGTVVIEDAHEKDKEYDGVSGEDGIAMIPVFASPKLEVAGYNGLYQVKAPNIDRTVWVPAEGGYLHLLPKARPADS